MNETENEFKKTKRKTKSQYRARVRIIRAEKRACASLRVVGDNLNECDDFG